MRTREIIREIQKSLYRMGVSQGRYLTDIPIGELTENEQQSIRNEAHNIFYLTNFELRLVVRDGRKVWRFFDRT